MIYVNFLNIVKIKAITEIRWFICAFIYVSSVVGQPASATLQERLDNLLRDDFYQYATAGVAVYDLTDQKMLYVHNEKRLARPASNMKILTSAAALSQLTSRYTFRTGLYYTGSIDSAGRLLGDVYLKGGFDPELRSADLDRFIARMKTAGIKSIEGNLFLDVSMGDSTFWGKAWSWDDDMEAYQPYLSPMPLNKGIARIRVTPAVSAGQAPAIRTEPESSFIQIINRSTTVQRSSEPPQSSLRFSRELVEGNNRIDISGVIASSAGTYDRRISLKNPNNYVLTIFFEKMMLEFPESNIQTCRLSVVPENAVNIGYVTRNIADVINPVNKDSDNLNAEMLLYALGYFHDSEQSSTEKGIAAVQQMMSQLGFQPNSYRMVDGSGLSNQNYLSPEIIIAVLRHMHQSSEFEIFRQSLPVAGVDGTLSNRMRNTAAHRNATAKTGSLTSVSALSGYVTAKNGNLLAFSILVQNFVDRAAAVSVNYIDKICVALAE